MNLLFRNQKLMKKIRENPELYGFLLQPSTYIVPKKINEEIEVKEDDSGIEVEAGSSLIDIVTSTSIEVQPDTSTLDVEASNNNIEIIPTHLINDYNAPNVGEVFGLNSTNEESADDTTSSPKDLLDFENQNNEDNIEENEETQEKQENQKDLLDFSIQNNENEESKQDIEDTITKEEQDMDDFLQDDELKEKVQAQLHEITQSFLLPETFKELPLIQQNSFLTMLANTKYMDKEKQNIINHLSKQLETKNTEISNLTVSTKSGSEKLDNVSNALLYSQSKNSELTKSLETATNKTTELEKALEESNKKFTTVQEMLGEAQKQKELFSKKNQELFNDMEKLKSDHSTEIETINKTKKQALDTMLDLQKKLGTALPYAKKYQQAVKDKETATKNFNYLKNTLEKELNITINIDKNSGTFSFKPNKKIQKTKKLHSPLDEISSQATKMINKWMDSGH